MEKFKFIASFETDPFCTADSDLSEDDNSCKIDYKTFLFDILSVIQYYCLLKILQGFGIMLNDYYEYDVSLICNIYFKNRQKINISELQNFIPYFNQFLNFNINNSRGNIFLRDRGFIIYDLIDKITEDMLINDFDKYIDAYDINKYTKLYMHEERNNITENFKYYMRAFMGDNVYISFISYDLDDYYLQKEDYYPIIECSSIKFLIRECKEHLINNQGLVDNTMSEHIVYTSDLEVTKQVLRNNQKIINNIIKNFKKETSDEASNSNKQKLMQLLTSEEIKPEVKPKQRTKITL